MHSLLSGAEHYAGTDPVHSPAIVVVCTVVIYILMAVLAWLYCIKAIGTCYIIIISHYTHTYTHTHWTKPISINQAHAGLKMWVAKVRVGDLIN